MKLFDIKTTLVDEAVRLDIIVRGTATTYAACRIEDPFARPRYVLKQLPVDLVAWLDGYDDLRFVYAAARRIALAIGRAPYTDEFHWPGDVWPAPRKIHSRWPKRKATSP